MIVEMTDDEIRRIGEQIGQMVLEKLRSGLGQRPDTAGELGAGPTKNFPPLLTPHQAAEYLGIRASTLAIWRCTGRYNLPFTKVGRSVRYKKADLDHYLACGARRHT